MHVEATSAGMGFKRSMRGVRANQVALLALGLQLFAVLPFHSLEELLGNLFIFNSAAWYLFSSVYESIRSTLSAPEEKTDAEKSPVVNTKSGM